MVDEIQSISSLHPEDHALTQALQASHEQQSVLPLLKEELKCKILYRRFSEGKGDIELEEEKPKVYKLTKEEEQRRLLRRQRNRESAERCRNREHELEMRLKKNIDRLSLENLQLSKTRSTLLKSKDKLLDELKEMGCKPEGLKCTCERRINILDDCSSPSKFSGEEPRLVVIQGEESIASSQGDEGCILHSRTETPMKYVYGKKECPRTMAWETTRAWEEGQELTKSRGSPERLHKINYSKRAISSKSKTKSKSNTESKTLSSEYLGKNVTERNGGPTVRLSTELAMEHNTATYEENAMVQSGPSLDHSIVGLERNATDHSYSVRKTMQHQSERFEVPFRRNTKEYLTYKAKERMTERTVEPIIISDESEYSSVSDDNLVINLE